MPQLMPEQNFRKLIIQDYGRRKEINCNCCGENYRHSHECKAINRLCYNCRQYGHLAKVCSQPINKKDSNQPYGNKLSVNSSEISVSSLSDKSINSDCEYVCSLMPFYDLDDRKFNKASTFDSHMYQLLDAAEEDAVDCNDRWRLQYDENKQLTSEMQILKNQFGICRRTTTI